MLAPEPFDLLNHLSGQPHAQVLAEQCFMHARVAERPGHVARRLERPNDTHRRPRVVRVVGRQAAPPLQGMLAVTCRLPLERQRLERRGVLLRQALALRVGPPFELHTVGQEETVQESTGVESRGARVIAFPQGVLERSHITPHGFRIHAHRVAAQNDGVLAQSPAQNVERVGEEMARPIGLRVRP